jgi:hypothetical protein
MKALLLAAALAALSSTAIAGAARDARSQAMADPSTTLVMADAGRIGSTSLASLNGNNTPWASQSRQNDSEALFDDVTAQVDLGTLLVALGVLAVALARPISRALRRQEQHRRAAALASTLDHAPRA